MTHLTGPSSLNGLALPYPDLGAAMEGVWTDESVWRRYGSGRVERKGAARLRGRFVFGWSYLDLDTAALILGEMQAGALTLTPRTKAEADPDWADEVTLEVRLTSALPSLAQLATGTVPLVVEVETLSTYETVPGTVYGGFYSEETEGGYEITPYGEATLTPGDDYEVSFLGVTYTLGTFDIGTPAIVALRSRPHPTIPGAILLDTTPAP